MTPEGKVVAAIKKAVKAQGGEVRKCQWVGHNGAPDLFIFYPGSKRFGFVEVKADTGMLSVVQKREINRMQEAGVPVYVVYGEAEAMTALEDISGGNKWIF